MLARTLIAIAMIWGSLAFAHDKDCEQRLLSELTTISYADALVSVEDVRGDIVRSLNRRDRGDRRALGESLARRHSDREMSFQVKNEVTGIYDKFVAVPVNPFVAPILKSDFDRLVQSTGPLMRLYRSLLRKIYSVEQITIKSLGLENLPADEAQLALHTIRDSIYLEPALRHPNMAHYPFLTVGGFDGAIVDPKKPHEIFFETNLGTPSGLSNNVQLLDDLLWRDHELRGLIEPRRPVDTTFTELRRALESNARMWTGRDDGVSVVVSPGIYNGAHPDVASIARASGLPLVKSSDLYEDENGFIRLNTGNTDHPLVTGIYGRMEESFFFQSERENIPLVSPQFMNNEEIGRRLNVRLRNGAIYNFIYDDRGDVTGVNKNANGEPELMAVWDSIGRDPFRPEAERGSFARAVRERRLYYSGLGGRVVDDKRLFRILTTYFLNNEGARPIIGLKPSEFDRFFADPTQFVVKEPNNSGGVGIYFPRAMPREEITRLSRRVRENPTEFEIQYVSPLATLPDVAKSISGIDKPSEAPMDLRIFVMMDSEGQVSAGPNSMLLRTGAAGGLYTNTSRGGGYGIAVVLNDNLDAPSAPLVGSWWQPPTVPVAISRADQVERILELSRELVRCLGGLRFNVEKESWNVCRQKALDLSFLYREIMDLLSPWNLRVIPALRYFAHNDNVDFVMGARLFNEVIHGLSHLKHISDPGLKLQVEKFVSDPETRRLLTPLDPVDVQHLSLPTKARLRRLAPSEVSYRFTPMGRDQSEKVEYAEYVSVDNPEIQAVIDEVKAFGGEVRLLLRRDMTENPPGHHKDYGQEPAYFWVNLNPASPSYLKPVIGIDLSREMALAGLYHEREHFRMVRELYANYRRKGFGHEKAMIQAYKDTDRERMLVEGERRAVRAEIEAEVQLEDHPYNRHFDKFWEPKEFFELGYVNRMAYPEFEGLRSHIYGIKWRGEPADRDFLKQYFGLAIDLALKTRERAIEYWLKKDAQAPELEAWRESNVYTMLTEPYGRERLISGEIREEFRHYLSEVCAELGVSERDCGVPRLKAAN